MSGKMRATACCNRHAWTSSADDIAALGLWLWRWDVEADEVTFNEGWESLLGYAPGSLPAEVGLFDRLCHPDDKEVVSRTTKALFSRQSENVRAEYRLRTACGNWQWFDGHATVTRRRKDGTPEIVIGVRRDATERKRSEAEATERELHKRFFSASNTAALWTVDPSRALTFVDSERAAALGLAPVLMDDEALQAPIHPDDRERVTTAWDAAEEAREPFACEFRLRVADGTYQWVQARAFPVFEQTGEIGKWLGATNIIHDRKVAEIELQEIADHLQSVIDTVPDAVVIMDEDGKVISFSAGAAKIFGYEKEEVVDQSLSMLMPKSLAKAHEQQLRQYRSPFASKVVGHRRTLEGKRKNGTRFPAEVHVSETRRHGRLVFSGHIRDLTEQRRHQQRMQQLQDELALAGRSTAMISMGSAIAHEVNQPLAAAYNYLSALKRSWSCDDPDVQSMLEGAAQQVDRAAKILKNLRDFVVRGKTDKKEQLEIGTIEEACNLAMMGPFGRVNIVKRLPETISPLPVARIQVQQAVYNVLRNAAEALATTNDPTVMLTVDDRPESVSIRIEDNGPGLPAKTRQQLFQSLRSSKPGGMGVGLAISRSLIEGHGGTIRSCTSELGGAGFEILLPR